MTVDRASLEKDIEVAREEVEAVQGELDAAEWHLEALEEQLAALPPDGSDEELFYARRDPRQIPLLLPSPLKKASAQHV